MTPRARMIACAVVLGACFAIGLPALFAHSWVVWGICCLISLPASIYVGRYDRAAKRADAHRKS